MNELILRSKGYNIISWQMEKNEMIFSKKEKQKMNIQVMMDSNLMFHGLWTFVGVLTRSEESGGSS